MNLLVPRTFRLSLECSLRVSQTMIPYPPQETLANLESLGNFKDGDLTL